MSEKFNNKDYSDYFSALEKSLDKKQSIKPKEKTADEKKITPNKKTYGGVIRFKPWVYITALSLVAVLLLIAVLSLIIIFIPKVNDANNPKESSIEYVEEIQSDIVKEETVIDTQKNFAEFDDNTATIASDIDAKNIIVINCDTNKVVAARDATARCYPASTTKIMTVLTAVENIDDINKSFTFSYEITDPFYQQEATMAGFSDGETASFTDMLYGAILESGADATYGLAVTVAGSEDDFVKLMNKKAKELGLKNTSFTNASGLFDKNHYTTPEDMAVIIRAAMNNETCREILSTYQYKTAATPQHPDGIPLTSTLFSYMYGTEPEGSDILGGKTGFVNESGHCFATFGKSDGGTSYVCVTLGGVGRWPTVYDQIDLYSRYAK